MVFCCWGNPTAGFVRRTLGHVWRDGIVAYRPACQFGGGANPFLYSDVKDRGSISFELPHYTHAPPETPVAIWQNYMEIIQNVTFIFSRLGVTGTGNARGLVRNAV